MKFPVITTSLLLLSSSLAAQQPPARIATVPGETEQQTLNWLGQRKSDQENAARNSTTFRDFRFEDGLAHSKITFRHTVVDEAGKRFRPNHYDHGTAVAAADVDNDGRTDLFFVNQIGGNELWRNLGNGRFENITESAGVAMKNSINVGASFGDLDNDGLPDLFVTTVKMGNHVFKNRGGKFQDVTASSGISEIAHSSGAVLFDFNRDGLLDIFICNVGAYTTSRKNTDGSYSAYSDAFNGFLKPDRFETSVLYQNLGDFKFRNVNQSLAFNHREWSGDATFCDLDQSGYPSLYVLSMSGRNAFHHNSGATNFTDQTRPTFGRTPWGAMGVKFFDYNNDSRFDLYLTDMHSDMNTAQMIIGNTNRTEQFERRNSEVWCSAEWVRNNWPGSSTNFHFGSAFFENHPSGFRERSDSLAAETYWPWGISVGDVNADGFQDAFITAGMGYPLRYGINSLLLNEHGTRFLHSEFLLGVEPRPGNKVLIDYFTLDCDGADKGHPFCQGKGGTMTVRASTSSRSSVFFDVDDDGDLDLVVNNMNDTPLFLVNNLSSKRKPNFLKIKLRGSKSNRDGLGATIKISTPDRTCTQFHDGKSGYLAQSSLPLYFGLDRADRITSLEIAWPSGIKQLLKDPRINQTLTITEPES